MEVKGPGDKLSTKQRLWLDFFKKQNIVAHVCHVSGKRYYHLFILKFLNCQDLLLLLIDGLEIPC